MIYNIIIYACLVKKNTIENITGIVYDIISIIIFILCSENK